jgi:glycosyltransferase involved in cell wall biosynthesis
MLSLSMIVRDEAERLGRCLASVQGFVDEMVVVDTGSQDGTVALARSLGATVHEIPWPGISPRPATLGPAMAHGRLGAGARWR